MRYALSFVPHTLEREKLALLRRQLCKRFENRKAVMYPVQLTLVHEFSFRDYARFMAALTAWCAGEKPVKLRLVEHLAARGCWGGVEIAPSDALVRLHERLLALCAAHGEIGRGAFDPHICLVSAKDLPSLHGVTSPVKKLVLDRIALVIQTGDDQPYRIAKHIAIGTNPVDLEV